MDISYDANLDLESVVPIGKVMIMNTWKLFHIHIFNDVLQVGTMTKVQRAVCSQGDSNSSWLCLITASKQQKCPNFSLSSPLKNLG